MQRERYSYRFADEVLSIRLSIKKQIDEVLLAAIPEVWSLSRPLFNSILRERFVGAGWIDQPAVFDVADEPSAKMDFLRNRVGVEVGFGHASFLEIDLLKVQVGSYSALDKIDVGVFITTTSEFKKR